MSASEVKGTGGILSQAEEGMKLFEAAKGTAAEVNSSAAAEYRREVDDRVAALEAEAEKLHGKDNKKERSAKGKQIAELKNEQRYVDACKIVKGLEPKFGNFVTKEAYVPEAASEEAKQEVVDGGKVKAKKEAKKQESAGLSPAETKELENLKLQIVERKAILKEQGMSGGQQNKDEEVVKMVNRMNELKEKQDPGSTKKEKDSKKRCKEEDASQSRRAEGVQQASERC